MRTESRRPERTDCFTSCYLDLGLVRHWPGLTEADRWTNPRTLVLTSPLLVFVKCPFRRLSKRQLVQHIVLYIAHLPSHSLVFALASLRKVMTDIVLYQAMPQSSQVLCFRCSRRRLYPDMLRAYSFQTEDAKRYYTRAIVDGRESVRRECEVGS